MTIRTRLMEKMSFAIHAAVISPQITLRLQTGNNRVIVTLGGAPSVECRT